MNMKELAETAERKRKATAELRMAPRKLKMNIEITFRNGVIHSSWATQKDLPKQKDGPEWTYRYATIEVDAP